MKPSDLADLLDADTAAKKLGITKRALYRLVERGVLPRNPNFRSIMIHRDHLDAFARAT